jgi:hypothetical protein
MTPENFVYWLQGFFEISDPKILTESQITQIKDHLSLVFKKETPSRQVEPLIPYDPQKKVDWDKFWEKAADKDFPYWQRPHYTPPQITC